MGLDEADDDVGALGLQPPGALQHRIGLADAGRGAEEDRQLAAARLAGQCQQGVGIGTTVARFASSHDVYGFSRIQREVELAAH